MFSLRDLLRTSIALLVALLALGSVGCGGGLAVTRLSTAQGTPSNLAVFMAVEREGNAVTGLTADDFTVTEDGVPLSKADAQLTLQPVEVGAVNQTLILVDRSGAAASAIPSDELVSAVEGLAERAGKLGKVAIYAFDGDEEIHPIVSFTDDVDKASVADLGEYKPKDGSSNLHGAVLRGVDELEHAFAQDPTPIHFGALIFVAAGPDRAARRSLDDVATALEDGKHPGVDVFTIGVGAAAAQARLDRIGRAGSRVTGPELTFGAAIDKTAVDLESRWKRYYLVSFCTPARKGEHKVRIDVRGGPASGSLDYTFVADGMGAGCDTNVPPKFAGLDSQRGKGVGMPTSVMAGVAAVGDAKAGGSIGLPGLGKLAVPAKLELPGVASLDATGDADDSDDDSASDDASGGGKKKHKAKDKKGGDKKKGEKKDEKKTEKKEEKKPEKKSEPKKAAPKPSGGKKK